MGKNDDSLIVKRPPEFAPLATDLNNLEVVSMEGAGVTGVIYTGALTALYEAGLLDKIRCFAGTSSGSIVATGAALGYRGKELEEIALNQNFRAFCQTNLKWGLRLVSNLNRDGMFSGTEMKRWISSLCAKRVGNADLTFGDLETYKSEALKGNKHYFAQKYDEAMTVKNREACRRMARAKKKAYHFDFEKGSRENSIEKMMEIAGSFSSLEVAATEIIEEVWLGKQSEKAIVFNGKTSPDLRISFGVRASASYPFIFRHAKFEHEGKERLYTDGGYTNIIPIPLRDEHGIISNRFLGLTSEYITRDETPSEAMSEKNEGGFLFDLYKNMKDGPQKAIKAAIAWRFGGKVLSHIKDEEYHTSKKSHSMALARGFLRMKKDMERFTVMGDLIRNDTETTKYIIPLNRNGILATNFNITNEQKKELIHIAYQMMVNEITRFQDIHPE